MKKPLNKNKEPKVSIVILNWNRAEDTIQCLKSISVLRIKNYELSIVVVDNGSDDISNLKRQISKLQLKSQNLKIIENKKNLGYAAGNNAGIKYALDTSADYIMILNNDTLVDRNLLVELIKVAEANSMAGAISPKIYFDPGFEFHKEKYDKRVLGKVIWYAGGKIDWKNVYGSGRGVDEIDNGKYDKIQETEYATGTCLFLRASAVKKAGMFDERYFMYYEDTELSLRLKKSGWKVMYIPEAIVWHKVAQSSGIGSGLNDYYTTRNRMLFGMKYASLRTKFALLRESIKLLLTGRKWQGSGIKDFYLGNLGKGSFSAGGEVKND